MDSLLTAIIHVYFFTKLSTIYEAILCNYLQSNSLPLAFHNVGIFPKTYKGSYLLFGYGIVLPIPVKPIVKLILIDKNNFIMLYSTYPIKTYQILQCSSNIFICAKLCYNLLTFSSSLMFDFKIYIAGLNSQFQQ